MKEVPSRQEVETVKEEQVPMYSISVEALNNALQYLASRPFNEVATIINEIQATTKTL